MIEPTDEMIRAVRHLTGCGEVAAWQVASAVLAVVARDRCMEARGHVYHLLAKPVPVEPPRIGGQQVVWVPPETTS